ncbi:MAG TPA: hypothetical protein VMK12_05030 [Anaeromyxobacteraceae bacterium]|nr:hypothetical protein [Anaeromyxobacteraceae bacterium]
MVWDIDLECSESWPEWFIEYRRARDTEMRERVAAKQRGEITERDFTKWIGESIERETRWRESLRPEQRAWLEEQEEADRLYGTGFVRGDPVDMAEVEAFVAAHPTCDPVRAYLKLKVQPARRRERPKHAPWPAALKTGGAGRARPAATSFLDGVTSGVTPKHPQHQRARLPGGNSGERLVPFRGCVSGGRASAGEPGVFPPVS